MNLADIIGGLVTGLAGGLFSGFLGVTAGGVLVPLLILILGRDQHVAQGISLVAQIVPTSLSGVRNYSRSGHRISMRWLIWLAVGFGVGGCIGALLAVHVPDRALQWCFVGYLVILLAIMLLRSPRPKVNGAEDVPEDVPLHLITLGASTKRQNIITAYRHECVTVGARIATNCASCRVHDIKLARYRIRVCVFAID